MVLIEDGSSGAGKEKARVPHRWAREKKPKARSVGVVREFVQEFWVPRKKGATVFAQC